MDAHRVVELTARYLAETRGGTESWWERHRPHMVAAGVLTKRGRRFFGREAAVDAWLEGRGTESEGGTRA